VKIRTMIESDGRIGVVVCDCSGGFLIRAHFTNV
jgi:hypothetical protein